MNDFFDELKPQEQINAEETSYSWFRWYVVGSFVFTIVFYMLVAAALLKYLVS